ncbi:MAG: DUF1015 family protein [Mucilaginibacter sp.]
MATIKPFRALRPDPFLSHELVFPGDEQIFYLGIDQKALPLKPLKEQLEAPARKRPETEEGQRQAYQEIRETIETLKRLERIRLDNEPGIYIYEIVHRDYRQTGIWALTSIKDYTDGKIKIHEHTLADSERRICNYRKNTGLEGSPVLLTYPPDKTINRIIAETCAEKSATIGNRKAQHRIWKIQNPETIRQMTTAFANIEQAYLADGHHRLAATARLAIENRADAWVSSLYIAADQLRIIDYHRVFIPENPLDIQALLSRLRETCNLVPSAENQPFRPKRSGVIGLCLDGNWYELLMRNAFNLDVVDLQEQILKPVFGVTDPRKDNRLKCIGGETAMEEIAGILRSVPFTIAFTLCPMTVKQLMAAAATGQILPPKSTWIDPKVPYGLLMHQHNFEGKDLSTQHYD